MKLNKEDIKENVDQGAYNRGYHYFKDGDVDSYEVFREINTGVSINSFVNGMQQYEQNIDISYINKIVKISGR